MSARTKLRLLLRYSDHALPGVSRSNLLWLIFSVTVTFVALSAVFIVVFGVSPYILLALFAPLIVLAGGFYKGFTAEESKLAISDSKCPNSDKNLKDLFRQFQPLLAESYILQTQNGNWVGLGHQDKIRFARDVTLASFLLEHNPGIITLHPDSEEYGISFKNLPDTMSTKPLQSISHIHYQYARYDFSRETLTITSSDEENSFRITYLTQNHVRDIAEELIEHDTSLHSIVK